MSDIFTPKRIGQLEVKNRLMRSATAERLVDKDGVVTDDLLAYYKTLAKGGVGTIVTGYTAVDPQGRSGWQMMAIYSDNYIKGLQGLTNIVHQYDTKIIVQLNHCGRYSAGALIGTNPLAVSASHEEIKGEFPPREATESQIKDVIRAFVVSAERAREAGFDGVQIHAAHGYLVSQFLSPRTNKRTDQWGGGIENRSRFLMEIIKQTRQKLGADFPIWIKTNCEDFIDGGLTLSDSINVIKYLIENKAEPDAIEISGGVTFDTVIRKDVLSPEKEAYFLPQAETFRRTYPNIPLILVGGIRSYEIMEKVVGEKKMDLVAMSRPFIRDPNFPLSLQKTCRGVRTDAPTTCISCNLCLGMKKEPVRCRASENPITKISATRS
ncbi:MAG: NADH:flavin oxidoreductase [Planctomycetota bacterium]|nr:NADH:flavin oxidoreductase [Planctomycetota bacterium]